jgi:putative RNA 2'-phosphotransferase
LGRRDHQIKVNDLGRLLVYILTHRPDEFCLVPDSDGFISYKELIQAINEEEGWQYVRQSHINEVLMGKDRDLFEVKEKKIRAMERRWSLDIENPADSIPVILYCAVRSKAHHVVMEKGLKSLQGRPLVMSGEKELCLRIGRRRDHKPVLLEIMAETAAEQGVLFYTFGSLFLSPEIPPQFIAGPPVSKEILEARRQKEEQTEKMEKVRRVPVFTEPGTFILESSRDPDPFRRAKGKKRRGWKEEARSMRRTRR